MSTTATTIETIKNLIGEKIEAWADKNFSNYSEGHFRTDALELLGMDEDEAIEALGTEITDLLCKVEIEMSLEDIEVERATYWYPGYSVSEGSIWVAFNGPEVDGKDFGGWVTAFGNGSTEIASGNLLPEDGLCDGLSWKKAKAAAA